MKKLAPTLFFTLGLAACGSTPSPQQATTSLTATQEPKKICTYEKRTGSNRKMMVCRTQKQIDAQKENADAFVRKATEHRLVPKDTTKVAGNN